MKSANQGVTVFGGEGRSHGGYKGKIQSLSSPSVVSSIKEGQINKGGRPWKTQSCHTIASKLLENKFLQW